MVLGMAQFVMVIDGTVMNVSITTVVADLGTSVSSMQLAIATFTLTMAALMLAGSGIRDRESNRETTRIRHRISDLRYRVLDYSPG